MSNRQTGWVAIFALTAMLTGASLSSMAASSAGQAVATPPAGPWPEIPTWSLVADGFDRPVYVADPDDGSGRLFVVEQAGTIRVVEDGHVVDQPFLDLTDLVSSGGERGLFSVAFDPNFGSSRALFVDYTDVNGNTVVARYQVSADDPNRADPASALTILAVEQPAANHNGGLLLFGPDGMLYVGLGDGGGGNGRNAQDPGTLLGKILRLDVSRSTSDAPYAIPPDNPFLDDAAMRPEIWVWGLRNPWRFSFDRQTGDLLIGDVGGGTFEEVDLQPSGSGGGENFGWPVMEGSECRSDDGSCDGLDFTRPIAEYPHGSGDCVVTGGYVYRGSAVPSLIGLYLFADYCSGRLWSLTPAADDNWLMSSPIETNLRISSFGEDSSGELYLVDLDGAVYRLTSPSAAAGAGS